jgi:hypothetical protein
VCDRNANYDVSVRNASKEIVRKDGVWKNATKDVSVRNASKYVIVRNTSTDCLKEICPNGLCIEWN